MQVKEPYGNFDIWLLVGFHPATRSVQSTPADNTRKRVWQYIEKERKGLYSKFHKMGVQSLRVKCYETVSLLIRYFCYFFVKFEIIISHDR